MARPLSLPRVPSTTATGVQGGDVTRLLTLAGTMQRIDERAREVTGSLRVLRRLATERTALASRPPADVQPAIPVLSEREVRILRLIADGKDNGEIADELHYSLGMIKLHVREILETLGRPTRAAAAVRAVRLGLI